MYCKNCGSTIEDGEELCANCGTVIAPENTTGSESAGGTLQGAYIPLEKHLLLLTFTFGVWHFIRIFKMTKLLNREYPYLKRNAVAMLLLCIFVPVYQAVWFRQSAKAMDQIAAQHGLYSDLTMVCTIAGLLLPVGGALLLQEKLNEIAAAVDAQG